MRTLQAAVLLACGLLPGAPVADAQPECVDWQGMPFAGASGPNGANNAVMALTEWDPDGAAGPRYPMLVAGGSFTSVEGVAANHVAARDPVTGRWEPLGVGTNGAVRCLAVYNGELVAGGVFTEAGGQYAGYIARWNGTTWQSLGTGVGDNVYALAVYNGELVAGGYFNHAGGGIAAHVARWNGSTWQGLGSGINDWVVSLAVYNGELIAGGWFTAAGGVAANRIARWNGASWQALGTGTNAEVLALGVSIGGLAVGGRFTVAGGLAANHIARWDGSWHTLGSGTDNTVLEVIHFNGELVAGGTFLTAGGVTVAGIGRWNGFGWQALENGLIGGAEAMFPHGDELVVGGYFSEAGAHPASFIASWNGFEWGSFGGGSGNTVAAQTLYLGRVVSGGDFHQSTTSGHHAHFIAAWDGAGFSSYGLGMDGPVYALKAHKYPGVFGANELIAGGAFLTAGGVAATRIARWQNDPFIAFPPPAWEPMGVGMDGPVFAIERYNSATYAGGSFWASNVALANIGRWNESSDQWENIVGSNGTVYALKAYGGYLYAGGAFTAIGGVSTGGFARYNGTSWSNVGGYFNGIVYALEVHNGQLVMAGNFPGINSSPNLAQYNGTTYSTFGIGGTSGTVRSLRSTGTRLYVGGEFTMAGGIPAARIAYWDGSWHEPAGGVDSPVYAMTWFNNELHVGGAFSTVKAGQLYSPRWAKFAETGVPWIAKQPSNVTAAPGDDVSFTATPAYGYPATSCQWYHLDAPLSDGPTGTGSVLSGTTTPTLTISNISFNDWREYRMVLSSPCGQDTSSVATVDMTVSVVDGREVEGRVTPFEALGPNPTRGQARLTFSLVRAAQVRFQVHDVGGRRVRAVEAGPLVAGRHELAWDGRDHRGQPLGAGLYFVTLEADGRRLGVRRLTVLR